jgi:type II secretory pathway component PulL
MLLLVLLIIAFVIGYWLSRSRYHASIDKTAAAAAQQPKKLWNRLFHRSEGGGPIVEELNQANQKEN